ncbi:hypothetical protein BGM26_15395 [Bacillus sp. FJAT-29790]|uniref:hypothetical protein n=1 Tax=Bacillus sp. FJAT-29790 TaxID=1895002 RepID=UPI001C23E0C9|nr:hypothetical protein [Bacillus sp. FJAT-29790]MBU8880336.1 hypothetical protein [Bacillus sp. FJAT-29790]
MLELISTYKWPLLVSLEVLFWVTFIVFLILKYWFQAKINIIFLVLTVISECFDLPLAVLDYVNTGRFSLFQVVIFISYIYALLFGKNNMRKLDRLIQRKVMVMKERSFPLVDKQHPLTLAEQNHAMTVRKGFYFHFLIFCIAHLLFIVEIGITSTSSSYISDFLNWLGNYHFQFFQNEAINRASSIWRLILIINGIMAVSCSIWPKEPMPR